MLKARSPWQVTWSVWRAMFMREAVARTMADRMAWFWMLAEPIAMVGIMLLVRVVVMGRNRLIYNAEFVPWLMVGLLGFYLFRDNMTRSMGAIEANQGLFAYRQVKPIDPVLVRCFLEGMLKSFILLLFIGGGLLLALDILPDQPLQAAWAWFSLWMLGVGVGLVLSAATNLVKEIGIIARMLTMPLLLLSGVILPIRMLPHFLLEWLMWNPIAHGLELLRLGFFEMYPVAVGTDYYYLWYWILGTVLLGLMLHLKFEMRLKAR